MTVAKSEEGEFFLNSRITCKNSRHVHHLAKTDDSLAPGKRCEVRGLQHRPAHLQRSCRDAGREHIQDVDISPGALGEHELQPLCPCDIGNLVRVSDDRSRAMRGCEPRILPGCEKRTFDMGVGIDQAGDDVQTGKIIFFFPGIVPDSQDKAVFHCETALFPGAGERIKYSGISENGIRRYPAPGCIQYLLYSALHEITQQYRVLRPFYVPRSG